MTLQTGPKQKPFTQFKQPKLLPQEIFYDTQLPTVAISTLNHGVPTSISGYPALDNFVEESVATSNCTTLHMATVRRESDKPVRLKLNLFKFVIVYMLCLGINLLFINRVIFKPFNLYLTVVWTAYLPLAIVGLAGAFGTGMLKPTKPLKMVEKRVVFMVPTIARHDTVPAMKRVINSILLCAPKHLLNYTIHIITEEGAEGLPSLQKNYRNHPLVEFIVVPNWYKTPNGTKYKARANQYALEYRKATGQNTRDVFIYHGDDDTGVGPDTLWSIAKFINHDEDKFDLAQGVLTYPFQLSNSWFCKFADSVRPADDLTRFHFFTGMLGRPLLGLHGEHLLVRANIEETIGWDFGEKVKVEDAYFGLFFSLRYRQRSTFLASCSYGASPASVLDLIKQRRRWAAGLFGLLFDGQVPVYVKFPLLYSLLNWTIGLLQHIGIVLVAAYLLGSMDTSPVLAVFIFLWCINFAYQIWLYLEGLRINLDASQARTWKYFVYPAIVVLLMPAFALVETWSATLGFSDFLQKKKGFEVISKRM